MPYTTTQHSNTAPGGGGTYYIFPTGMCRFSGYRFLLFLLEQGIKRRQFFWSRLSKHAKRGNFVTMFTLLSQIFSQLCTIFSQIFVFLTILFIDFFLNRVSFEGKILEQAETIFFHGHIPVQI